MATRCICPPESWLGRLVNVLAQADALQTASRARLRRSARDTPDSVSASSTFAKHGLVRDEVVALEHEADAVVAVGVPVAVLVRASVEMPSMTRSPES